MQSSYTILLVDDENDLVEMLRYNLEKEGYKIITANDGSEAVQRVQQFHPDVILMDVMMPNMDGIEACQEIRNLPLQKQPIIAFLTSRAEDYSQIAGFQAGGDDYIPKPIRPKVLVSRLEALTRRLEQNMTNEEGPASNIVINREKFLVEVEGKTMSFPKKEFELLEFLAKSPGKVFTRDQLLFTIWGTDTIVGERTVDVHIRKLREKLGNDYIRTIKGIGYTFNEF